VKKYNYFDDEADEIEEVKKSNSKKPGKIDLSTIINKFKKIEATVHEEAEEDIEVVEKFPLLRSAVIKGLWIAGAILIAIIMAVSFSVSLNSKNKKAEQFNKDAGNVCINYIKKYGSVKWEALDEAKYGENKAKLTGVCYARQMDFNGNGRDELMLCYNSDNVYYLEVWGYHKGDFCQLYKNEANSTQKEAEGYWVSFYRKGNKYLICKNDKNNPQNLTTYTLRNGKFRKSGTASYDIASDTYSIKGKIIKDKFETIELSCFRKSKAEITTELVSANIDAFGNISSQAIANTLSEKERKANAYYEVVRKRLEKYGQPSIKTDDDGEKYIDGVAYVKQIDFNADGNDELCMVYRTYKSMSKYDEYSGDYIYYDKPQYSLDIYKWDGNSAKRVINKECVSVYFDDDSVFYLLLKKGKKTTNLCTNNYDKENNYNFTANSKEYAYRKGVFTPIYSAKEVNDYGYKSFYINDERVYNREWEQKGYNVPLFLNDEDSVDTSKYDLTYFSGENSSDFEQTLKNTIEEIQKLNKEYTPENDTD